MAELSADMRDLLALALVPGLGPRLTDALITHFGSLAAIRSASPDCLARVPGIGSTLARRFADALANVDLASELVRLDRHGVRVIGKGTADYPSALAEVVDAPHLLYVRGTLEPADGQGVAIVGTRHCSRAGIKATERIAAGLARAGVTVISGLARGIDGAAHRAAVDAGGRTVAVLAGGLSRIYPPEHTELADAVCKAGALVTETPMAMSPQPGMFPARNRIISGLSRAVVVVEAGKRSGALITASHAAEQGRDVYAVPGAVDAPESAGCLELIRQGAKLVRDAEDVLEELNGLDLPMTNPSERRGSPAVSAPSEPARLDPTQKAVWEALRDGPAHADELVRAAGIGAAQLNAVLLMLEMRKAIRRLPGNRFERC